MIFTPKIFWLAPKTSFLGLHFLGIVGDALSSLIYFILTGSHHSFHHISNFVRQAAATRASKKNRRKVPRSTRDRCARALVRGAGRGDELVGSGTD